MPLRNLIATLACFHCDPIKRTPKDHLTIDWCHNLLRRMSPLSDPKPDFPGAAARFIMSRKRTSAIAVTGLAVGL
jgi:hypothetical protein